MNKEEFVASYVRIAKKNFQVEIDIRTDTRLHEIAVTLGISLVTVKEMWYADEVSDMSLQRS